LIPPAGLDGVLTTTRRACVVRGQLAILVVAVATILPLALTHGIWDGVVIAGEVRRRPVGARALEAVRDLREGIIDAVIVGDTRVRRRVPAT
jgi:hypothetical protein